jgi:hypothetical protein
MFRGTPEGKFLVAKFDWENFGMSLEGDSREI